MTDTTTSATPHDEDAVVVDNATLAKERRARFLRGTRNRTFSVMALLVVWQLVSMVMNSSVVPNPIEVFIQIGKNLGEGTAPILAAGYFGQDWGVETGEFLWKE